jgi:murein DD-endopeptidase MepM/ murein hydrolase activator NlpD
MKLTYPLSSKGTKTSSYGYRTHPINGTQGHHNGVDIGVPDGTDVFSVADGEVVRSDMKDRKGYGNFIIVKHSEEGETFYSAYAHLTKRLVDVGDKVNQGDKIAESGGGQGLNNGGGSSTGPHLHFEIRKSENGDWVNPEPYISGSEIVNGDFNKKDETLLLNKLVVTYNLSGRSKTIVDTAISYLKNKGITNPYAIIVICTILLEKYDIINEESTSEKLLGPNSVTIPSDGAHAGQSGWQSANAWDFKAPIGSPVFAVNSGKLITWSDYGQSVKKRGGKKLYGESFTVKTDNDLPSVYYTHLKDTKVRK